MRVFETRCFRGLAVVLAFLLIVQTVPLSAAEPSRASIGSVSAVGMVDLRGVAISGDGTLFSGDRMNVGSGAYAKVALTAGPKIEVDANSDVTVTKEDGNVLVRMASGNVAFKGDGKAPVRMLVGHYEVNVPANASGNVAYVGKDVFGVRVVTGSVNVRNTATKETFTVQKGNERLVSLQTGTVTPGFQKIASTVPSAVPALPQPKRGGGLSTGGTLAMIGIIAGSGAAIAVLVGRNNDNNASASARLAQAKTIQNLAAIEVTATQTAVVAQQVTETATAALNAINASTSPEKAALAAAANATISQANSATQRVSSLTNQLHALQNEIANQDDGPSSQQQAKLDQLLNDLTQARNDVNNSLNSLNNLLDNAKKQQIGNLPQNPNLQNVNGPDISSASAPL
jgi:hypothetical protein